MEMFDLIKLMLYAIFILVLGIVMWKVSASFLNKKSKEPEGRYFRNKFGDQWKKRR